MSKSLEQLREEEITHVLCLAATHGLTVIASDIEFANGSHYPHIEDQPAEDWILTVCGCEGACEDD